MDDSAENRSFGVFKPVGHVVVSFPTAEQAQAAVQALADINADGEDVRRFSDREMIERIDEDIRHASPVSTVGQEMNLVRAHRALAEQGYHWLVVRAASDKRAAQIAEVAQACGAERAQHYGRFIIEELIDRPGNLSQVGESPDRGLDAQTPSGKETEAGALRKDEA